MAKKPKKSAPKVAKSRRAARPEDGFGAGDLRAIPLHVQHWENGVEEAHQALLMLGRDAVQPLLRLAEEKGDGELADFARRLVAVRPQVDTNLYELRIASVRAHVQRAREEAPLAQDARGLSVAGGSIVLFDPDRLREALARGGRPKKELERHELGDLVWVGLSTAAPAAVHLTTEDSTVGRRLRLRVDSGVVFVGPPEASDGPRLGTVRLDPDRTQLDEHLGAGGFFRLKPGVYKVMAWAGADGSAHFAFSKDPDPKAPLELTDANPHSLSQWLDESP